MNKTVNTLMQKDMTRKEFLTTMGLAVVSVFGFSTIVNLLTGKSLEHDIKRHIGPAQLGYGASAYGGKN